MVVYCLPTLIELAFKGSPQVHQQVIYGNARPHAENTLKLLRAVSDFHEVRDSVFPDVRKGRGPAHRCLQLNRLFTATRAHAENTLKR